MTEQLEQFESLSKVMFGGLDTGLYAAERMIDIKGVGGIVISERYRMRVSDQMVRVRIAMRELQEEIRNTENVDKRFDSALSAYRHRTGGRFLTLHAGLGNLEKALEGQDWVLYITYARKKVGEIDALLAQLDK